MDRVLVIHYDEIALKGGNRRWFEEQLARSIRRAVEPGLASRIQRLYGRLMIIPPPGGEEDLSRVAERIALLPGIASVLDARVTDPELGAIEKAVHASLPAAGIASFGVRARRGDKSHPLTSDQVNRAIGGSVQARTGWKVDLGNPDLWIWIEIVNQRALVATRRFEGPGGLPVGGSGRAVALLSGGIDSPVAAWMMMTRGLELTLVHFHSAPFTSRASQEKVRELAGHLTRFQAKLDLVLIPFADPIQRTIIESTPERYRVVLYRRFMMRLAGEAARAGRAKAIVTGESLGQVASQTIENLTSVQAVCRHPVLRPLIGLGKRRIVELARRIGTFEISIRPHEDCCSYLMPRRPATRTTVSELDAVESSLPVDELVARTWESRTVERLGGAEPDPRSDRSADAPGDSGA